MTITVPTSSSLIPPRDSGRFSVSAVRELLEFPCQWLADLPDPFSLRLIVAGAPVPIVFDTAPRTADGPVLATRIVFDRDELRALALGVEADRIWHREFLGFCFEKWRKPTFRVGVAEALDGAMPDIAQVPWSLERVLRRLQANVEAHERAERSQPWRAWSVAA